MHYRHHGMAVRGNTGDAQKVKNSIQNRFRKDSLISRFFRLLGFGRYTQSRYAPAGRLAIKYNALHIFL